MANKQFRIMIESSDPDIAEKLETILTYEFPDNQVTRFSIHNIPLPNPSIPLVIGGELDRHRTSHTIELMKLVETTPFDATFFVGPIPQKVGKENYIQRAKRVLSAIGIPYKTSNSDMHFMVDNKGNTIDYWPTTGLWRDRSQSSSKRGFKELLRHMGVPKDVY